MINLGLVLTSSLFSFLLFEWYEKEEETHDCRVSLCIFSSERQIFLASVDKSKHERQKTALIISFNHSFINPFKSVFGGSPSTPEQILNFSWHVIKNSHRNLLYQEIALTNIKVIPFILAPLA